VPAAARAPRRAGTVRVLLSGREADLPPAALRYAEGRLLAGRVVAARAGDDRADAGRPGRPARPVPA